MDARSVIYQMLNESSQEDLTEVEEKDVRVDLRKLKAFGRKRLSSRRARPPKKDYGHSMPPPINPDEIDIDLTDIEPEPEPEVGTIINQSVIKDVPYQQRKPKIIQGWDVFNRLVQRESMCAPDIMVTYALGE